jgi:hypothetical protein
VYESYAAETDVQYVLLLFVGVVTAVQYASQHYRYKEAKRYFFDSEKVTKKALDLMAERGQVPASKSGKVSAAKVSQEVLRATKQELVDEADIGGGYGPPGERNERPPSSSCLGLCFLLRSLCCGGWILARSSLYSRVNTILAYLDTTTATTCSTLLVV